MKILFKTEKKWTWKIQKSKINILVLNRSPMIGSPMTTVSFDHGHLTAGTFDCKWHLTAGHLTAGHLTTGHLTASDIWTQVTFDRKCHLQSNVTCGQMSRGQMSLAVKRLAIECHYGQMSRSHMSLVVKCHCSQMSRGQTSMAVKDPAVKCHLRSSFSNLGCQSKIPRSKVPRSNVTCGQVFLILVAGPKSRGQLSLRSNVSWSNVPRSNVT